MVYGKRHIAAFLCVLCVPIVLFAGCGAISEDIKNVFQGDSQSGELESFFNPDTLLEQAQQAAEILPEGQQDLVHMSKEELGGRNFGDYLQESLTELSGRYPKARIVCYVDGLAAENWVVLVQVTGAPASAPNRFLYLVKRGKHPDENLVYMLSGTLSEKDWNTYIQALFGQEPVYFGDRAVESILFTENTFSLSEDVSEAEVKSAVTWMAVYPFGIFQVDEVEFSERSAEEGLRMRRYSEQEYKWGMEIPEAPGEWLLVREESILPDVDMTQMSEEEIAECAGSRYESMIDYRTLPGAGDTVLPPLRVVREDDRQRLFVDLPGQDYEIVIGGEGSRYQGTFKMDSNGYYGTFGEVCGRLGYCFSSLDEECRFERSADGGTLWQDRKNGVFHCLQDIGIDERFYFEAVRLEPQEDGEIFYEMRICREGEEEAFQTLTFSDDVMVVPYPIFLVDMNDDGYRDIELSGYEFFFWSPSKEQFIAYSLEGLEQGGEFWGMDPEQRLIWVSGVPINMSGDEEEAKGYEDRTFQWENEADIRLIKRFERIYGENKDHYTVYDYVDGEERILLKDDDISLENDTRCRYLYYDTIAWMQTVERLIDGTPFLLYYAQAQRDDLENRLPELEATFSEPYEDHLYVLDEEKRLIKMISWGSSAEYLEIEMTDEHEFIVHYSDGSEKVHYFQSILEDPEIDIAERVKTISFWPETYLDVETTAGKEEYIEHFYRALTDKEPLFYYSTEGEVELRGIRGVFSFWRDRSDEDYIENALKKATYSLLDLDGDGGPELVVDPEYGALVILRYVPEEDRVYAIYRGGGLASAGDYHLCGAGWVSWEYSFLHDKDEFGYLRLDEAGKIDASVNFRNFSWSFGDMNLYCDVLTGGELVRTKLSEEAWMQIVDTVRQGVQETGGQKRLSFRTVFNDFIP